MILMMTLESTDQIQGVVFFGRALRRCLLLANGHVNSHQRILDAAVIGMAVHQGTPIPIPVHVHLVFGNKSILIELAALATGLLLRSLGGALAALGVV